MPAFSTPLNVNRICPRPEVGLDDACLRRLHPDKHQEQRCDCTRNEWQTQNTAAEATQPVRDQPLQAFDTASGTVWDGIPEATRDSLALPPTVVTSLALIKLADLGDKPELWASFLSQPFHTQDQACAVIDVLHHVSKGETDEAITRAELYAGLASSAPENVGAAITAGTSTDTVIDASAITDDELRNARIPACSPSGSILNQSSQP